MAKRFKGDLPTTYSGLLRAAVHDAQACERDPAFVLDMADWLAYSDRDDGVPDTNSPCQVCMAGAVIAQRSGVPLACEPDPTTFTPRVMDRLLTVNSMRVGYIPEDAPRGMRRVDDTTRKLFERMVAPEYYASDDGRASWDTYLAAADFLEARGY